MNILITGATGFVGSHLIDYALTQGAKVFGSKRWRSSMENLKHLKDGEITLVDGDLTDPSAVRRLLEISKPDWIFHLAAQSFVKTSFDQPRETLNTNISMQINLLHGLREGLAGRMLVAGSSEEYGLAIHMPINEDAALLPLSPYAVSKVAQDLLAYQYHRSYGVHVVRARAFNHTGPRRGDVFVTSNFAKQIAEIEAGLKPPILYVGNLQSVRDYTDVRDTVRAYWALLDKGVAGEVYNVGSGYCAGLHAIRDSHSFSPDDLVKISVWRIDQVLAYLLHLSTRTDIEIKADESRMRPSDVPRLVGDYTKLHKLTGWKPEIQFTDTLRDLLGFWRGKIRKSRSSQGSLEENHQAGVLAKTLHNAENA